MDRSLQFNQFRKQYEVFSYNNYKIRETKEEIVIEYEFEIQGLTKFHPTLRIQKKNMKIKDLNTDPVKNMVFHMGLMELISYWKATCSPTVVIRCGFLNQEQIAWWKKIYYYGLGELFYTNQIETNIQDFMQIKIELPNNPFDYNDLQDPSEGYIVPIGGGKDSNVTIELLNLSRKKDYTLIINPKPVTLKCAEMAGFANEQIIEIFRKIDPELLRLNQEGFMNGHTPFSGMLAFVSYFVAYLIGKAQIALSNENSANESNVIGEKINHQYSKSYEFECDFTAYAKKYLKAPVKYFSFLRPLNELQIAQIFARLEKYHSVFKSCNVGSKSEEWKWCCNCPKCLFAYTILSPYLYPDKLRSIFGEDLFEKESLLKTFLELTGNGETKPFECVGTFEEVNFAISKTIENLEKDQKDLPYLLTYYRSHYPLVDTRIDLTKQYNEENNLTKEQNNILRKEVLGYDA